ncbi:unnamed protein product [Soboliphyme baturini]|uniref:DUF1741 domain-containing protein n=1 Tax=Soboliphyme baturini TaxID=241478 RepID=A0A183IE03_9BILA|nr:unnamed protein product [Soboliphyme baturini]
MCSSTISYGLYESKTHHLLSAKGYQGDRIEAFWQQFWSPENVTSVQDVFSLIPSSEIRLLRENSPNNLATLCCKAVRCLVNAHDHAFINCCRLLTRIFFVLLQEDKRPLAKILLTVLCDLLFCPDFTVANETVEYLHSIDSCEYIWEAGVGFATSPPHYPQHDSHRVEILRLLLTCFSEIMYVSPNNTAYQNRWIKHFTSAENRHVLPLFTSLINTIFSYDPIGYGMPYNYLLFLDSREPLVSTALQVLNVCLEKTAERPDDNGDMEVKGFQLFLSFTFSQSLMFCFYRWATLKTFSSTTYLGFIGKRCDQFFSLFCCKFLFYVLKSSNVLDILIPVLYHLNDSRNDRSRIGLVHMGVFILLLLSGERNFGVRLNKPYTRRLPMDISMFTGSHADLLIIVFHKLITTGNHRLQSLFDCLLTIIVNVSPYLKSMSMVAANKLLHLLEAFSTPWFLYGSPNNHHLVFFLLEIFNNIVQYQFDGNYNLVYTLIRKRQVFYQLANLPTDDASIAKALSGRKGLTAKSSIPRSRPDILSPVDSTQISEATPQDANLNEIVTVQSWKQKLPLQTVMRLLQVLVPQVEKICIDKMLTDENEILKFLQHGTLVGLLPVPHPILIRKYQGNAGTNDWFRTYLWGIIYLKNNDPPIWYDTAVKLFEVQKI